MEILQSLYQKRLNSLAHSFLDLLQQLQKTISPFSDPQLSQHRLDYLSHIITSTLDNDRERFIKQLFSEIEGLKSKLSLQASSLLEQPMITSKALSRNSTCSRESQEMRETLDHKYQSNGFQSSKKSLSRNPSTFQQTYCQNDASMCESTVTCVLKKKGNGSRSQTTINFENELRFRGDESKKEDTFEFKYLRIGKC